MKRISASATPSQKGIGRRRFATHERLHISVDLSLQHVTFRNNRDILQREYL